MTCTDAILNASFVSIFILVSAGMLNQQLLKACLTFLVQMGNQQKSHRKAEAEDLGVRAH